MATILIENLGNIRSLVFEIPAAGVHVLTGANGSGKTTLLTCLERLANSYAFQRHFKTSRNAQFDNFHNAKITYFNNGNLVTYRYRNTNWAPTPRANASILANLGFQQAIYLTSYGERFYIQSQELQTTNIISAPNFFKDSMNTIFAITKYSDLRRVKLSGKGKQDNRRNFGFLMPGTSVGGQNIYFT